jgi:hypothetical protein
MQEINNGRVLLGGLLAGLIINVGETILNVPLLGAEMDAAMRERGLEPVAGSAIGAFVLMAFALGIAAVWLYAAIRPRFGPGPKTAICAGLVVWALAYLYPTLGMIVMDLFPMNLALVALVWGLFEATLATLAGAWLYREADSGS